MNIINIDHLTKDYGDGKGVFDVSIKIKKGEVYGYLGPNGAGKSTTMRHLMGFSKPQIGTVSIYNMDCWKNQRQIQKRLGYLPVEIAFPDDMTGIAYLKLISKMRKMKDFSYAEELLKMFELNPNAGIKRMSKGMKQKIGIVSAFMHDPDILLLDEPTSGLDPLMQNRFIELVEQEKNKGKTIILSSHIFEEVEKTCDRIGMIRNGKLIKEVTIDELRHSQLKTYKIEFQNIEDMKRMQKKYPSAKYKPSQLQMIISINDSDINHLISALATCSIHFLKEEKHTLEEYFMQFYGGGKNV
ncbi:ABC transporter [[Clostridium] sordellii]|uniref:ABC transporter ATP-binding protein n=1 Tax=Paraclostridium sordellii TaxID=1505 RepID=UPI0005E0A829|nr:ABC transporter ATP-binding protein [Paeniclostridium sordellii]CEP95600.1 ABC transporter [[Clostridium] sordellii] [Paeniclostridium sordellii]